jgi:hypothetical protein
MKPASGLMALTFHLAIAWLDHGSGLHEHLHHGAGDPGSKHDPNDGTHWMEGVGLAGALAASTATFAPPCAIYFAAFRLMRRF